MLCKAECTSERYHPVLIRIPGGAGNEPAVCQYRPWNYRVPEVDNQAPPGARDLAPYRQPMTRRRLFHDRDYPIEVRHAAIQRRRYNATGNGNHSLRVSFVQVPHETG